MHIKGKQCAHGLGQTRRLNLDPTNKWRGLGLSDRKLETWSLGKHYKTQFFCA